jgi:hypothetical protein
VTPPGVTVPADRLRFLRARRQLLGAAAGALVPLAAFALLLGAPNRLASVRIGTVSLAWWAAATVAVLALVALVRGVPGSPGRGGPATGVLAAPALAAAWTSPAVLVGVTPPVLADGSSGLWPALALAIGAGLAVLVRAGAWSGRGTALGVSGVALRRWPEHGALGAVLAAGEAAAAVLLLWAQLAAVRELGGLGGWPRGAVLALAAAVLAVGLARGARPVMLAGLAAGAALVGILAPLAAVATVTTPAWPRAWHSVASRPRVTFPERDAGAGAWAVRGPAPVATLHFDEEQWLGLAGAGRVVLQAGTGEGRRLELGSGRDVRVRPGDRVVVPEGTRVRFEAGRRVPGAPGSGPAWAEGSGRPGWAERVGIGIVCVVGALGLAPVPAPGGGGRLPRRRAVQGAVILAIGGVGLAVGWALYAAWLAPEIYTGGVTGTEIFGIPAVVSALGPHGGALARVAAGALGVGALGAGLAVVRGLVEAPGGGPPPGRTVAVVGGAAALACLAPTGPFPILVGALGIGAAVLAPAALLATWSERATPPGLAAGAAGGLVTFAAVAVAGAAGGTALAGGTTTAVLAAAATAGAGVNALLAWLARGPSGGPLPARRGPVPRGPLPPGLDGVDGARLRGDSPG